MLNLKLLGLSALLGVFHELVLAQAVPRTIHLESRVAPAASTRRRRALEPVNVPLDDFFLGTDLQWFGNISIGTPPQIMSVVFDTGSTTLEFASTLCGASCANQTMFNPNKSSTFIDGGRKAHIIFATGVGVTPVMGDNVELTLLLGFDDVHIGDLSVLNTTLFLITNQTATFDIDPFGGILGLGPLLSDGGIFASLVEEGLPAVFSFFVAPEKVGHSELTLGGIDTEKFDGHLTFASLSNVTQDQWILESPEMFVNDRTLIAPQTIIFDSGTSNVLFPTKLTEEIYAIISPDIKPFPGQAGAYGVSCDEISKLKAEISIAFTAQDGTPFNLTIPTSELNVGPFADDPTQCQTLINAFDGLSILGGSLFKHYYSVWDAGAQRMGFAAISV